MIPIFWRSLDAPIPFLVILVIQHHYPYDFCGFRKSYLPLFQNCSNLDQPIPMDKLFQPRRAILVEPSISPISRVKMGKNTNHWLVVWTCQLSWSTLHWLKKNRSAPSSGPTCQHPIKNIASGGLIWHHPVMVNVQKHIKKVSKHPHLWPKTQHDYCKVFKYIKVP